ncbi:hypothetical protein OIV83_006433 [Microbotryomycetes sp. JL201]|nr:hypothetical protein OIV83_006433 [Microbotryomycetes sp. JL201]
MTSSLDSSADLAVAISFLEACGRSQVADELLSLSAIYDSLAGNDDHDGTEDEHRPALSVLGGSADFENASDPTLVTLRLILTTTLPASTEDELALLLTVPPAYPDTEPPLIQLKSVYLSSFSVSDTLWSAVLRTFMHESGESGIATRQVEFVAGQECLYQGIEFVRDMCQHWVDEQKNMTHQREVERVASSSVYQIAGDDPEQGVIDDKGQASTSNCNGAPEWRERSNDNVPCPQIVSTEPLVERKSVFVGHAAAVRSVAEVSVSPKQARVKQFENLLLTAQVQAVMNCLLSDKKIARATHNISAFRFTSRDGVSHADNDDDGETAAGGRLAHLLTLVHASDVIVVVTRWYGGVHLGPQRFQLINQAARAALELGGFLPDDKVSGKLKSKR